MRNNLICDGFDKNIEGVAKLRLFYRDNYVSNIELTQKESKFVLLFFEKFDFLELLSVFRDDGCGHLDDADQGKVNNLKIIEFFAKKRDSSFRDDQRLLSFLVFCFEKNRDSFR